ncbi:MAG TPA: tetratricopeptide repeat protein [Bryobacteraceae bacterium]|nr:tetratricopeptide repeat protein [Bryobacteraceae bacterium]
MRRLAVLAMISLAGMTAFAQTKAMKPKSKAEETAVRAMLAAADPDARIKAADDLITQFADTEFKPYALYLEADAYLQKGDAEKSIVYGEQALDVDPHSYQAAILLCKTYASTTHANDLDKAEKLGKIDKYGHIGLDSIATATKPNANLPDAEWLQIKNDLMGQAYYGLGVSAVFQNKIDDANTDFQKVAELDTDPTDMIRAGRALLDAKKPDQAIQWFDKAAAFPNATDQIKKIAASDKARAQSMIKK